MKPLEDLNKSDIIADLEDLDAVYDKTADKETLYNILEKYETVEKEEPAVDIIQTLLALSDKHRRLKPSASALYRKAIIMIQKANRLV